MNISLSYRRVFNYVGKVEKFVCPFAGVYKLEVWGGQGGFSLYNGKSGYAGGLGGYSKGYKYFNKDDVIYICVGSAGENGQFNGTLGGFNGGGAGSNDGYSEGNTSESAGGGGGATHIAYTNRGVLREYENHTEEILLVAGGGGGASFNFPAGPGGGEIGGTTSTTSQNVTNQTSGYAFGQGEDGVGRAQSDGVGGGGGGWYGGYANNVDFKSSGSGGSGYIGGVPSFTRDGIDYTPITTSNIQNGHGSAVIETFVNASNDVLVEETCSGSYSKMPRLATLSLFLLRSI